jgi:hypothetical protein
MNFTNIIILSFALLFSSAVLANADQKKAKAYYFAAEESFLARQYDKTLSNLKKTEEFLGIRNARIILLEAKARYAKKQYNQVKKLVDEFYNYSSSDDMQREISKYLVRIDNDIKAEERARQEALAAKEREKQQRLAAEVRRIEKLAENKRRNKLEHEAKAKAAKELSQRRAKSDLRKANDGDFRAMRRVVDRYARGDGFKQNHQQSRYWNSKIKEVEVARSNQATQEKIDRVHYLPSTLSYFRKLQKFHPASTPTHAVGMFLTIIPTMTDVISSDPTKATIEIKKLKESMIVGASAWGNPDSMIAYANRNQGVF